MLLFTYICKIDAKVMVTITIIDKQNCLTNLGGLYFTQKEDSSFVESNV